MEPQEQVSRHKIKKAIKLNKLCFDNKVWIKWYQFLTEWTNRNFVDDTLKMKNVKQYVAWIVKLWITLKVNVYGIQINCRFSFCENFCETWRTSSEGRLWKISCCENSKTTDLLKSKTGTQNHAIVQNNSVDNADDEAHKRGTDSFLILTKDLRICRVKRFIIYILCFIRYMGVCFKCFTSSK